MNALSHADEILAALRRLHPECALPGAVGSPMDDRATLVIPRALFDALSPVIDSGMLRAAQGLPSQERRLDAG